MDGKAIEAEQHGSNGSSIAARLDAVERAVPPPEIADVWLFPPLPDVESSAEFLLFTRILEGNARALYSARMVPENGTPAHQVIVEHGSVPAERVSRIVGQLQRRLGHDAPPRHVPIEGEPDRWRSLRERTGPAGPGGEPAAETDRSRVSRAV